MVGENQHHDVPKVRCEMIQLQWKIDSKQISNSTNQAVSKFCSLYDLLQYECCFVIEDYDKTHKVKDN